MPIFRGTDGHRSATETMQRMRTASATHLRERATKARRSVALIAPLVAAVVVINKYRMQLFGVDEPVRLVCAFALVGLGAAFSRDAARALGPALGKRLNQGTAG